MFTDFNHCQRLVHDQEHRLIPSKEIAVDSPSKSIYCPSIFTDQMLRATPLKIFDENSGPALVKQGKIGGLSQHDGPLVKKGLQPSAVKSTRKALSNLSTSQINIRQQTPAASMGPSKAKTGTTMKTAAKIKAVDEFYVDDFKPDEMLCTRLAADEDYFDLKKPKIGFDLSASFSEPSWANDMATPMAGPRKSVDEQEDDGMAYVLSLASAPMLDLSSST